MSYQTTQFDDEIVHRLQNGSVGFLPADTIYGLSASALSQQAVERIYDLKGRDREKPCIILIADVSQLQLLDIDEAEVGALAELWPAPLSIVCQAGLNTPWYLHRGSSSLAVRLPDHAQLRRLIYQTGPIVSTSANLSGSQPALNPQQAIAYFGSKLDFIIDQGDIAGAASTVIKKTLFGIEVLRQGDYVLERDRLSSLLGYANLTI